MASPGQIIMAQSCAPSSFVHPTIFGVQFNSLQTELVTNYSSEIPQGLYGSHHAMSVANLKYCKVSLAYTHPGYNDTVNTQVWLPVEDWNGRLQATGGGGLAAGLVPMGMAGAVSEGYAVVSTDGGHFPDPFDASWALTSPGNLNWFLMQDFMQTCLGESAIIGKAITQDFYGQAPKKSYWNGCSMGGRQGLQLAQTYPDAFDGILAAAPAIEAPRFIVAEFWPQMIMNAMGVYPPPCEFDAITKAAIEACDELDGVKDGIVGSPELCTFDAKQLVGKKIDCPAIGKKTKISETAVKVMESAWEGARRPDGSFLWHGLAHETPLTGPIGLANTVCDKAGCKLQPFPIPEAWIKYFVKMDPTFDVTKITHEELVRIFQQSYAKLDSMTAANDPDLRPFAQAGGKMITWHGFADQVIHPNGSRSYYEAATKIDPQVKDYYRYFEAPGIEHCFGGIGAYPSSALDKLVEWVEQGKAPETLPGASAPGVEHAIERDVCIYPLRPKYKGTGDIRVASSFECA